MKYYDNYIYVAAGQATLSSDKYTHGFFRYSLLTSTWEDISNTEYSYKPRFYTRSALADGYFYLVYGWTDSISQDIPDIMRVDLTSTDFAWEQFFGDSVYVRNSFAMAVKDLDLYIFGGFMASASVSVNNLIKLNLLNSKFTVITKQGVFPSSRSGPSLNTISTALYLFAGQSTNSYHNDMWIYYISSDTWKGVNQLGQIPSARSRHAADSQGDAVVIWGGVGPMGLLGDMYIFNSLTYSWSQLSSISVSVPTASKGACLAMDLPNIYIFGGLASVGCLGQLWIYNIGNGEFSLLSNSGPKLAYITCQLLDGYFYVLFGQNSVQESSGAISRFNFVSSLWESLYSPEDSTNSSSQGIQMVIGNIVVRIGGEAWDLDPKDSVYIYQNNKITTIANPLFVGNIPELVYLSGFTYYNTSFYSFGGGGAVPGGSLRLTVPSQLFIQINMNDICSGDICMPLCSQGTVNSDEGCITSRIGHISQGFGNRNDTPCPAGTINSILGANSIRQCYPCPEGYFTSKNGSSLCLQCPSGYFCSTGCKTPTNVLQADISESIQPALYDNNTNEIVLVFEIIAGGVISVIILVSLFSVVVQKDIDAIDLFSADHNYHFKKKMLLEKNMFGGYSSLIFISLAIIMIGLAVIAYVLDNISESKALVPLVILQADVVDFNASSIQISSSFLTYGDSCAINNTCSPLIFLTTANIRYSSLSYTCELSTIKTCVVFVSCISCILDPGAYISISLQEKLSYSSGILVNISSSSSIPNKLSIVAQSLYPTPGYMFIGSSASQFFFTMTPSLFKSESPMWTSMVTGYHISSEMVSVQGSQYLNIDLPITSMLNLKISMDKSIYALLTARTIKQTLIFFFSGMFGSFFGLMGLVGFIMKIFEGNFGKGKVIMDRNIELKNMKDNRKKIKIILSENLESERVVLRRGSCKIFE